MKTPKQTLDKLNEGCGSYLNPWVESIGGCGEREEATGAFILCSLCQARKNQFIEDCKNVRDWIKNYDEKVDCQVCTGIMQSKVKELEEVINRAEQSSANPRSNGTSDSEEARE